MSALRELGRETLVMRAGLALLVLIIASLPAFAQEVPRATIRVAVKTETGPVAGAVVNLNGVSVPIDQNGIATTALPLGNVEVSVSKEGFLPAKLSLQVDEAREWRITVELKPEQQAQEEVTVFATRTDTRLQDLPTRVEVLGQEEIDEKTMMTPGDIVMMLNETGGLRVQSTSPSLGAASVRIQGMRGRYTAFLGDGLPLFGQQGGGLGLLQIPPVDLGQAWGWYVQVGKYVIPRKLEVAVRYGVLDPSTKQQNDLTKEFGASINYSFDGTYNNRLVVDYSNLTVGSGGRAPDRFPFENQPGFGRDLIENRINVQYQFYF